MIFKKKLVIVNGKKVFYWEKNHTNQEVLVLLHGFPGNHSGVMDMAEHLGDYRIIMPDFPACGQSESLQEKHILKNYSKWLSAFLENIYVDRATIIGYSFGSRVALTFGVFYPEKVIKLVLITPVVRVDSLIARIASLEYEIAGRLPKYMQKTWLSNKIYHGLSNMIIFKSASKKRRQHLIDKDAKEVAHLDPRANLELFQELYSSTPISKGNKINIKTLIIAADKDEIATPSSVKELYGRFTEAELKTIKNAGHIAVAERPKRMAAIIKKWLQ